MNYELIAALKNARGGSMNHDKYDQALAEQAAREHRHEYYWNDEE